MRVAIVGCGHIGRIHLSYLLKTPGVEVVSVCDSDRNKAQRMAREFAIPGCHEGLEEALSQLSPDVVHILTPPSSHASLAVQALDAGSHVFIEKPFALSLSDVDRVIASAKRTGRKLCVDHNHLFDPPVLEAIRHLESGALGELVGMNCFQGVSLPKSRSSLEEKFWFQDLPLGPIQDVLPHTLAFLLRFVGTPCFDHALVRKAGSLCTEVRILAEGKKISGSCTVSLRTRPFMHVLDLYGSEASVRIDVERMMLIVRRDRSLPFGLRKALPPLEEAGRTAIGAFANAVGYLGGRLRRFPGIGEIIRRFYQSLENGSDLPVAIEDAREVVRLTDQLVELSKDNQICACS